ncbi:collagen alpha-1(XX) chain [Lingula anatina]|uniref:Collagen alpha-1(XX) chain n=1 Tax=Lingula anatina TaxID=7574 RepID=A0A1S3J7V8_LINAN|nr:collagen alpha-1(XX) chain [Lingula anatina]|eukprot:XP_013406316.1 collagen alpha-1(XX) chain [Lingula anatina]
MKIHCLVSYVLVCGVVSPSLGASLFEGELQQLTRRQESFDCIPPPRVEIAFCLDASKSIKVREFKDILVFIKEFITAYQIGPDSAQVALATFSVKTTTIFDLNDNSDLDGIIGDIDILSSERIKEVRGDRTNTSGCLYRLKDEIFTEQNGMRAGVHKIAIVVTDGRPNSDKEFTIPYANDIKNGGTMIFAIGIGQKLRPDFLYQIASEPTDDHVILVKSAEHLMSLKTAIARKICRHVEVHCEQDPQAVDHHQKLDEADASLALIRTLLSDLRDSCVENRCPDCFTMNETLGTCYRFGHEFDKMSWADADLFCAENFGARSASVTSPEEREFIRAQTGDDKSWWTSGNDLGTADKFTWADSGKLMTEGASSLGKNAPNQRCVKLREATLEPEATPCDELHNVICKTLI